MTDLATGLLRIAGIAAAVPPLVGVAVGAFWWPWGPLWGGLAGIVVAAIAFAFLAYKTHHG